MTTGFHTEPLTIGYCKNKKDYSKFKYIVSFLFLLSHRCADSHRCSAAKVGVVDDNPRCIFARFVVVKVQATEQNLVPCLVTFAYRARSCVRPRHRGPLLLTKLSQGAMKESELSAVVH
jgi:hypothetical protein